MSEHSKGEDVDARKAALSALLASTFMLAGCAISEGAESESSSYVQGTIPTEQQVKIARDLGADDEEVAKMLREGMDKEEYRYVLYAEEMLEHLQDKYGESFKAVWISLPGPQQGRCELSVTAESGDFIGSEFSMEYDDRDSNRPRYADNYFNTLKAREFSDYLLELVRDIYAGTAASRGQVDTNITSSLHDDSFGPSTDVRERASEILGNIVIYLPPDCSLNETEYYELFDALEAYMVEKQMNLVCEIVFITELPEEFSSFSLGAARAAYADGAYQWRTTFNISPEDQ